MMRFKDRQHAGAILAQQLQPYAGAANTLVLALPRGGVPVAAEIARALNLPMDIVLVRKLGVPGNEEVAMGAIAIEDVLLLNEPFIARLGIPATAVASVIEKERAELQRRLRAYRSSHPFPDLQGKRVILVDDGIATGATMRAAIEAVRRLGAKKIIVAAPVAPPEVVSMLQREADSVIVPLQPLDFRAVGQWYDVFDQTDDDTVRQLLAENWQQHDAT
ncbi:putative phosphoribosyl transferase [Sulfurivirga caldicuralii]|uniref:Putative phosphoribosyl transferase n=1 Tax=Sulfurivirga caldicuralii TaxID=364032 RepID=A0A1N6DHL9_9GAMM|nr:phosphoribosyltransferase [Sulfurivirga caldicuralii]SIN70173.1 putative phosphoribosyl transferase [Sulfurivirga caldicuralii]